MAVTRVKICGITNPEDAELAAELGAWAIGLIFHEPSPRSVDPDVAEVIGAEMRRRLEVVGVFVNEPLDRVAELAERCSLSILQLHGDEGPAYCREAARRTGAKVMKAVRVHDRADMRRANSFRTDYHLLDTYVAGLRGGTGQAFPWEIVDAHDRRTPVVLSGGMTPDNVADAVAAVRPFAVDSASGTEAEQPGRKDPAKVKAFFRAVEQGDRVEVA
jgi:phosphoribosylanthranilate isomerase